MPLKHGGTQVSATDLVLPLKFVQAAFFIRFLSPHSADPGCLDFFAEVDKMQNAMAMRPMVRDYQDNTNCAHYTDACALNEYIRAARTSLDQFLAAPFHFPPLPPPPFVQSSRAFGTARPVPASRMAHVSGCLT